MAIRDKNQKKSKKIKKCTKMKKMTLCVHEHKESAAIFHQKIKIYGKKNTENFQTEKNTFF